MPRNLQKDTGHLVNRGCPGLNTLVILWRSPQNKSLRQRVVCRRPLMVTWGMSKPVSERFSLPMRIDNQE